jgi:Asp-tRNA(Asn)/Glu-tRNA(Gln) amidotransferase A subunit family amidase
MDGQELAFSGVARQAELVRGGDVSSAELVELYLERIGRLEPELNAFRVVMAERALADARQADARRGAGEERPLLGVPVAVKTPRTSQASRPVGAPLSTRRRPSTTTSSLPGCAAPER